MRSEGRESDFQALKAREVSFCGKSRLARRQSETAKFSKSTDLDVKSTDMGSKSYDTGSKSYDTGSKSYDTRSKSPDIASKSVAFISKSLDLASKSPDLISKSPDFAQPSPASHVSRHNLLAPTPQTHSRPRVKQSLGLVSLVVRDYDEALSFFVGKLGFVLIENSFVPEQSKRWVVVAPPGASESRLLLARASTPKQQSRYHGLDSGTGDSGSSAGEVDDSSPMVSSFGSRFSIKSCRV
jgi:hypothetical protein